VAINTNEGGGGVLGIGHLTSRSKVGLRRNKKQRLKNERTQKGGAGCQGGRWGNSPLRGRESPRGHNTKRGKTFGVGDKDLPGCGDGILNKTEFQVRGELSKPGGGYSKRRTGAVVLFKKTQGGPRGGLGGWGIGL